MPNLIIGVSQRNLTSLASSTNWEFSISILKFNVKMAPEMSGCFNWLPLFHFLDLFKWGSLKYSCIFRSEYMYSFFALHFKIKLQKATPKLYSPFIFGRFFLSWNWYLGKQSCTGKSWHHVKEQWLTVQTSKFCFRITSVTF